MLVLDMPTPRDGSAQRDARSTIKPVQHVLFVAMKEGRRQKGYARGAEMYW